MRPMCLKLKGFTSFKEETTVSFAHLDRFAVCGPTGAGKSSLFDALTFALFAAAPRVDSGSLTDLVSLGRKGFSVSLDFRVADREYHVERSRSRTGGDQHDELIEIGAKEPLATGARPVNAAVEKLLGLSYAHFTQSVFLPQGKFAELLRSRPGVRRKLLNELLRLMIYERMRENAGQEREAHGARMGETERRLREDFAGVSTEVRDDLARQLAQQQQVVNEADRKLPELRLRWEQARCKHDWTTELEAKQVDRARQAARQPEIDTAQRDADAAGHAAEVVPLLDQADSTRGVLTQRQEALADANRFLESRKTAYTKAKSDLDRAAAEAGPLAELRERLQNLARAVGKLSLCDQLTHEIDQQQLRHDAIVLDQAKCAESLSQLATTLAGLDRSSHQAELELTEIGYDEARAARLESVREDAFRLRSGREQLIAATKQAELDEARAEQTAVAAAKAEEAEQAAKRVSQQAQRKANEAERQLRAAEDAHKAAHLRAGLQPGQPCPVCLHKVARLPAAEQAPELEERQRECAEAEQRLTRANDALTQLAALLTVAQAHAAAASQQAQISRADATSRQLAVDERQNSLQEKVGDLLPPGAGAAMPTFLAWANETRTPAPKRPRRKSPDVSEPAVGVQTASAVAELDLPRIEERILSSLQQIGVQAEKHRQAAQRLAGLRNELVLKTKEKETREAENARLAQELQKTIAKLAEDRRALTETQAEIQTAAGTSDPVTESDRVHREIDRLDHLQAGALQAEAEASKHRQIAETCARETAGAQEKADQAQHQAGEAMRRAGFADTAAVRAAFRTPPQLQVLRDRIAEHAAMLHALDTRIAELESNLKGQRVSSLECQQSEKVHSDCLQARQQAHAQALLLSGQVESMNQRLERSQALQAEMTGQERSQQIYEQLARDLRSDNFQAFLLEETLAGLVRDASVQLLRLTGDRYGLHFEEERIYVIDNDNAADHRGIETLSGGETFLASLALALALSEQVQKIAGAVHLDCLFIDEGFGALDPETLRTVSDTIRALQVGGRMVGVITHIPELKEEFDQRLIVERKEGTSTVRMEIC